MAKIKPLKSTMVFRKRDITDDEPGDPPERLLNEEEFRDFDFSPREQHVACHACGKNVITLGKKHTIFGSDLERHQGTKKHGKQMSQNTPVDSS
ncbi:hypothetical protein RvY_03388 [Ramazzottius varieornatus]|uniref:Uncharacterized protein n=1 Tax=Ramazzottius varieornatus TaxID=947166 RepID=A0A1D1UTM7_RAMVA|nr:hypothetical protein RvY_03388 [Ramazzottius varieornatus]